MKRLSLLVGAIALSTAVFAQRPTEGNPFSLEGQLSLSALNQTFSAPSVKLRYFAADNISIRLGLGFDNATDVTNAYGNGNDGNPSADSVGVWTSKASNTMIAIGGAYHFSQMDRLSPYGFLDVMIGMGGTNDEMENYDGNTDSYMKGANSTMESKYSTFGLNIGAGFDYYFAENVFVGAEVGFLFNSWKDKDGSMTVNSTTTTIHPSGNNSAFMTNSFGLRLGWRF
ncbi:MAG: hypothetical protein EP338_12655 [Bacteroidetes bacterium]|nr:MAG: hypothetical protein EP338_12655 [Bacteroidota bacterium]